MNAFLNQQRWQRLCQRLGILKTAIIEYEFQQLVTAYGEPHRAYHTAWHINECLELLDWAMAQDTSWHSPSLETALWYHDAIYRPQAADNEQQSASWAVEFLQANKVTSEYISSVVSLIMATHHSAAPETEQTLASYVVDIDLAILGAPTDRFLQYNQQIQQEYSWLPADVYKTKRQEILSQFLSRPVLYRSALFRDRFEIQARKNLSAVVSR